MTIVQSGPRLVPTDHPRNSEAIRSALERDGVDRAARRARAAGAGRRRARTAPHVIDLDDGSTAEGHAILLAVGRDVPARRPRPRALRRRHERAGRRSRATAGCASRDGLWVIGDPAGPELHTHQAHYQGELAVRMALGEASRPTTGRCPARRTPTRRRRRSGVTLDQARDGRPRRLRVRRRLRDDRARATRVEAKIGHVTIVVDRATRAARRGGDGLPGRVGGDPRVRRSRSRRGSRSTSWPRRSTRSRRRRGSSTACSPTRDERDARPAGQRRRSG